MRRPPTEPPVRPGTERVPSLVLLNTGDGKGKTTAAMGTMLRALARGWRVCVVQFIKSGEWRSGEAEIARRLGVDWRALGGGFTWDAEDLSASERAAREAWERAKEVLAAGQHDLVILDEVTYPAAWGWIAAGEVAAAIRERPSNVNVILTGRDAPEELVDLADTVTEMVSRRHAFDRGVPARRGIDY